MVERVCVLFQINDVDSLDREGKWNNICVSYGGCKYVQVCGVVFFLNFVFEVVFIFYLGSIDGIVEEYYQCKQSIDRFISQLVSYREDLVQKLYKDGVCQMII